MRKHVLYLFICLITVSSMAQASDMDKEKRWAEQITDSILVGQIQWLDVNKQKILSIYTAPTVPKVLGGALILHGSGAHPNWPDVVYPLRTKLPDYGWHTLSIQMPILANSANYEDYAPLFAEVAPRIEAGIKYLQGKGIQNIVIIAHSLGTTMAANYLATHPSSPVRAFVAVGMPGQADAKEPMNNLKSLAKIKLPMLDIFGGEDLDVVRNTKTQRAKAAARAGNTDYTQLEVLEATHFFTDQSDTLVKRVRGWLEKHAAGTEIKK